MRVPTCQEATDAVWQTDWRLHVSTCVCGVCLRRMAALIVADIACGRDSVAALTTRVLVGMLRRNRDLRERLARITWP